MTTASEWEERAQYECHRADEAKREAELWEQRAQEAQSDTAKLRDLAQRLAEQLEHVAGSYRDLGPSHLATQHFIAGAAPILTEARAAGLLPSTDGEGK